MVSSAQINYPAKEKGEGAEVVKKDEFDVEKDDEKEKEPENEEEVATGLVSHEEQDDVHAQDDCDASEGTEDGTDFFDAPSGRPFSISPEEFCADPYEQHGQLETRQELGKKGEEAAVKYLLSKGYEILKRNWFCRFGEADIIARDADGTLCFIEVKTRRSIEAGIPEEAITRDKRKRYERIALCYMMVSDEWEDNDAVRFDAICICVTGPHRAMLRHHKGSFDGSI